VTSLTVTPDDVIARRPCADWAARIPAVCERYRRERWSALDVLSLDDVPAEDRLWVCLHPSLVPDRVLVRFACEVAAEAMRLASWTDPRSWAALDARMAFARGEIGAAASAAASAAAMDARDAAWAAASDAARAAARAAARDAASAAAMDAASAAAMDAARAAARDARDAQIVTLRTLLLLDADGYDVLRGELGKPITERRAA
jgi:hypothetical protein